MNEFTLYKGESCIAGKHYTTLGISYIIHTFSITLIIFVNYTIFLTINKVKWSNCSGKD